MAMKILFLCVANSARSQLAEGLARVIFPDAEIQSAGSSPAKLSPYAVAVMDEIGIDISQNRSKSVDEFAGQEIDYVLTVCDNAQENCPYFPAKTRLVHHAFDDPAAVEGDEETRLAAFRRVRDEISDYLRSEYSQIIGLSGQ